MQKKYSKQRNQVLGRLSGCRNVSVSSFAISSSSDLPEPVREFGKLNKKNSNELLSDMIALSQKLNLNASPVAALNILSNMLSPLRSCSENQNSSMAFGTLCYFCSQYKDYIQSTVQAANIKTDPNFLGHLTSFVKLQHNSSSIWATLYYCLRCGDANSASVALNSVPYSDVIDQPVIDMIQHLAQLQSNSFSLFRSYKEREYLPADLHTSVVQLYSRFKARNYSNDFFQLGTLALLSIVEPLPSQLNTTIEDYYFSHLWISVLKPSSNHFQEFVNKIKFWGPSYFED